MERLLAENAELSERVKDVEKEYFDMREENNERIRNLEGELAMVDQRYVRKLTKETGKREVMQRKLNVEERERELYGLKLEQVLVNNKKLMLQKKFLEKQLEKDAREVQLEMNKIQIEIQQEGGSMLSRFHSIYQAVMDQMSYVQ